MFEKILVPLDGSEHSMRALDKAVHIAKKFGAQVTLIHVYSLTRFPVVPPMTVVGAPPAEATLPPEVVSTLDEAVRRVGVNTLKRGEQRARAERVQVTTLLREGHVVDEILKAVREGEFNLIVIGARGLSTIKEILLGSVSHGVTIHAPCPVLVVK